MREGSEILATKVNSIFGGSDISLSRRMFTKMTALGTAAALSGISNVSAYPGTIGKLIGPASAVPEELGEKLAKSNYSHGTLGCVPKLQMRSAIYSGNLLLSTARTM